MANETLVSEVGSREGKATVSRPPAAALPKKPKLSVVVAESWAELEPYVAGWERLAAAAIEANIFYEPWMFKPALETLGRGEKFVFVLVLAEVPPGSPHAPLVCGFFPLVRRRRYKCFPVQTLSLWGHIHCYVCTPLIHAAYASECLHTFFEWLRTDRRGAALLECKWIPGEGPFHRLLVEHLVEQRLFSLVEGTYARALLCPRASAQAYLEEVLSGERRRRLRRHEERLKEEGKVEYTALTSTDDARAWLEEFLRLEAAGWKGQEGTALQCREEDRRFFLDALMEAFHRGRLMMMGLHLNGRPIALFCDLLAAPWSFVFKLTFDEAYSRFSPGALLELEKIRRLHERPEIRWADSCNAPGPSLLKELWADRRLIDMMVIASGKAPGPLVLSLAPLLRWVRRKVSSCTRLFRTRDRKQKTGDRNQPTESGN